jgi:hypothetical protein
MAINEVDLELVGKDFNIEVEGAVVVNHIAGDVDASHLKGSYITLSKDWNERVRVVITAKLDQIFKENKIELTDDFDLGRFVEEAYIEIKEVGGTPTAIIIGKQPIAFGQNVQEMPIFENNPLADLQEIKEVHGLTVDLSTGLFGLVDQFEVSVFETEDGDLNIGKIDGLSVRMSKLLTDQWLVTGSHARLGNNHLGSGTESRTSLGLIGENEEGTLVGWAEGIYFSNNPEYPNSQFGITIGGMIKVHETTDVIVEYSHIEKAINEIAIGVKTAVTANSTIGAEVRHRTFSDGRDDDLIFGVNYTIYYGNTGHKKNESYLFGNEDNEIDEDEWDF